MAFAVQLKESIRERETHAQSEFERGDGLSLILNRYLLTVEAESDSFILTSILLVDGPHLRHGAAPNLPEAYTSLIDGLEHGPNRGSCGTAAHRGHPVYVTDIATDPLWADFKDLALPHGLRACWSTPFFDDERNVIGTFAIYHLLPSGPTQEEIDAIQTITESVARAVMWSKEKQQMRRPPATDQQPLKLV